MTGDCHVRFCESRGAQSPPATHHRQAKASSIGPTLRRATSRRLLALAALALLATLAIPAAPGFAAGPCPNEAIREEQHATYLPDCRAYEQVSPTDKDGADVTGLPTRVRAAVNGNGVQYSSLQGFGDVHGISVSTDYLAVRQPGGWANHAITPTFEPGTLADALAGLQSRYLGDLSSDLSRGVFIAKSPLTEAPNVALAVNLYLRDDLFSPGIGHYQLLTNAETLQGADSSPAGLPALAGASADFSHVLFESRRVLNSEAFQCAMPEDLTNCPGQLYEWVNGSVRFAGLIPTLPDTSCGGASAACIPAPVSQAGRGATGHHYTQGTVSQDGSRIVLTVPDDPSLRDSGRLYLRDDHGTPDTADDTTVQVNASERTPADPATPATFWAASADLGKVFFTTSEKLTDEDPNNSSDLYEYDLNKPTGERLARLSVDNEPADNQGNDVAHGHDVDGALGASADGSYIYFVSRGQFVAGGRTECMAASLPCMRIFVWHQGTIHEVGAVNTGTEVGSLLGSENLLSTRKSSRLTPDGTHLVFLTQGTDELLSLYGRPEYDHGCGGGPSACFEVYLFDATANGGQGDLQCASCNPSGAPASANALFYSDYGRGASALSEYQYRLISDDGRRVFFDSAEPLIERDTNGVMDVYEYDTATEGLSLISSGTDPSSPSILMDVSPDGNDVFFTTRAQLRAADTDQNTDLYDARIGGGFPEPPAPAICDPLGAGCLPPVPASPGAPALSTTSLGPGDPAARRRRRNRRHRHRRGHHRRAHHHRRSAR